MCVGWYVDLCGWTSSGGILQYTIHGEKHTQTRLKDVATGVITLDHANKTLLNNLVRKLVIGRTTFHWNWYHVKNYLESIIPNVINEKDDHQLLNDVMQWINDMRTKEISTVINSPGNNVTTKTLFELQAAVYNLETANGAVDLPRNVVTLYSSSVVAKSKSIIIAYCSRTMLWYLSLLFIVLLHFAVPCYVSQLLLPKNKQN